LSAIGKTSGTFSTENVFFRESLEKDAFFAVKVLTKQ